MNSIINKFLILSLGVSFSAVTIEATSNSAVMAQQLCQFYKLKNVSSAYVYANLVDRQRLSLLTYGQLVKSIGMSADGGWMRVEYLRVDGEIGEGWVDPDSLSCYQGKRPRW